MVLPCHHNGLSHYLWILVVSICRWIFILFSVGLCLVLLTGMARPHIGSLIIRRMGFSQGLLRIYLFLLIKDEILISLNGQWVMVNLHLLYARKVLVSHLKEPSFMEICLWKDLLVLLAFLLVISLELVFKLAKVDIYCLTDFFKVIVFRVSQKN
jgi:hypothetical protein